jgi:endonuclease III
MRPLVTALVKSKKRVAVRRRVQTTTRTSSAAAAPAPAAQARAARPAKVAKVAKKVVKKKAVRAAAPKRGASRVKHAEPQQLLERLQAAIPDPHVELHFRDPWSLLVAVILSAQSTDRTVNLVTPELFRRWPTPRALADAAQEEVELVVKSTGFFRNKAKAIRAASLMIVERFGGSVPRTLDELVEVPGVARKTANVVLGAAYGVTSGIVTDTHAMRVAQRLALTSEQAPEKIEADLCRVFEQAHWIALSHMLVLHGRHLCTARAPGCNRCALNELCPAREAQAEGSWPERAEREASDMAERSLGFVRALAQRSARA